MENQLTFLDNLYNFSLLKYEPNQILLVHKGNKKPYTFHPLQPQHEFRANIIHPALCRPILFRNGLIYPKGDSNLLIQLDNRIRSSDSSFFSQEEINNTFIPIIECVEFLHQKNILHGNIAPESMLFFENGDILLKDWLFMGNKMYYLSENPTMSDDLRAIGLMIAQACCLQTFKEVSEKSIEEIMQKVVQNYEKSFCYGLIILLKGMRQYQNCVLSLLCDDEKGFKDETVLAIYKNCLQKKARQPIKQQIKEQKISTVERQKSQKVKKQPITESKISNYSQIPSFQGSPTKKFNITTQHKKIRIDDLENKKTFNDEVKKRQIQKITKIIERSNAFVNELMARKNNEKKGTSTKGNNSLYEPNIPCENSMKKSFLKESGKLTSPSKRLRTISKKK